MGYAQTYGDYAEAAARMEIAAWHRAVDEGRIVLVTCPFCGCKTTQSDIDYGEHEMACFPLSPQA